MIMWNLLIFALAFRNYVDGMDYPQPTSLPTSLFIAPSVPEDISSQIVEIVGGTTSPTVDSRREEFGMANNLNEEDDYALNSIYVIAVIALILLFIMGIVIWKRLVNSVAFKNR